MKSVSKEFRDILSEAAQSDQDHILAQAARIAELEAALAEARQGVITKVSDVLASAKAAHKLAVDQNEGHSIRTGTACYVKCAENILALIDKEPDQ